MSFTPGGARAESWLSSKDTTICTLVARSSIFTFLLLLPLRRSAATLAETCILMHADFVKRFGNWMARSSASFNTFRKFSVFEFFFFFLSLSLFLFLLVDGFNVSRRIARELYTEILDLTFFFENCKNIEKFSLVTRFTVVLKIKVLETCCTVLLDVECQTKIQEILPSHRVTLTLQVRWNSEDLKRKFQSSRPWWIFFFNVFTRVWIFTILISKKKSPKRSSKRANSRLSKWKHWNETKWIVAQSLFTKSHRLKLSTIFHCRWYNYALRCTCSWEYLYARCRKKINNSRKLQKWQLPLPKMCETIGCDPSQKCVQLWRLVCQKATTRFSQIPRQIT